MWSPRSGAATGQVVLTEDLRLSASDLGNGSLGGARLQGSALTLGSGEYVSPELQSSFPATHVGVHWRGLDSETAAFWLRSSQDGAHWSGWQPVRLDHGHGPEGFDETVGALIRVDKAEHFQFRVDGVEGDAALETVILSVLNSEDGPVASPLVQASAAPSSKPLTYSREAWGANEALRFKSGSEVWPRNYVPTKKCIVHHTATSNSYSTVSQAQADVRAVYTYHASSLGWGDIGYNWLIDKFGNSYEGRRGRDGPGYDGPGGRELVSEDVIAGHARSFNHGSTGISLLGSYDSVTPSTAMVTKLKDILAWECSKHYMDPQRSTDFLRADDIWARGLPNICGHRDTFSTACPGSRAYSLLSNLRSDTASRLAVSGAPTASIQSAPSQGTNGSRTVSYSWSGSGGSGARQYSYFLEGWALNSVGVSYYSGFNSAREPAWGPWTSDTAVSYTINRPGHYTFHVRARDGSGKLSVYEDNRTFLSNVSPLSPMPEGTPSFLPGISVD